MNKIIFEGTEEQIKNLKKLIGNKLFSFLIKMLLIEHGDNDLPKIRDDYQKENLWCVEDVQSKFKCTKEEALEVLEQALTNEATMEQIWYAIDFHGEDNELERV